MRRLLVVVVLLVAGVPAGPAHADDTYPYVGPADTWPACTFVSEAQSIGGVCIPIGGDRVHVTMEDAVSPRVGFTATFRDTYPFGVVGGGAFCGSAVLDVPSGAIELLLAADPHASFWCGVGAVTVGVVTAGEFTVRWSSAT